jgi:hypothetical protein
MNFSKFISRVKLSRFGKQSSDMRNKASRIAGTTVAVLQKHRAHGLERPCVESTHGVLVHLSTLLGGCHWVRLACVVHRLWGVSHEANGVTAAGGTIRLSQVSDRGTTLTVDCVGARISGTKTSKENEKR